VEDHLLRVAVRPRADDDDPSAWRARAQASEAFQIGCYTEIDDHHESAEVFGASRRMGCVGTGGDIGLETAVTELLDQLAPCSAVGIDHEGWLMACGVRVQGCHDIASRRKHCET
jgi:hypothetical protein